MRWFAVVGETAHDAISVNVVAPVTPSVPPTVVFPVTPRVLLIVAAPVTPKVPPTVALFDRVATPVTASVPVCVPLTLETLPVAVRLPEIETLPPVTWSWPLPTFNPLAGKFSTPAIVCAATLVRDSI